MASEVVPPELEDVAEQIGFIIEHWGFKNVLGRIWTHLFLSPDPLDAGQIMDRLKISKALTSMSLSELLEYDVIEAVGKGDRGTVLYQPTANPIGVIATVLRGRERRMLCRTSAAVRTLSDLPSLGKKHVPLAACRVKKLVQMVQQAEQYLDAFLAMSNVDFSSLETFTAIASPADAVKKPTTPNQ